VTLIIQHEPCKAVDIEILEANDTCLNHMDELLIVLGDTNNSHGCPKGFITVYNLSTAQLMRVPANLSITPTICAIKIKTK
jgi:hypothetical protein